MASIKPFKLEVSKLQHLPMDVEPISEHVWSPKKTTLPKTNMAGWNITFKLQKKQLLIYIGKSMQSKLFVLRVRKSMAA